MTIKTLDIRPNELVESKAFGIGIIISSDPCRYIVRYARRDVGMVRGGTYTQVAHFFRNYTQAEANSEQGIKIV